MKTTSSYSEIDINDEIHNSLIKPIHKYARKISPQPEIVNGIAFQKVYSESLIHRLDEDHIFMLSRPAIQQYREVKNIKYSIPQDCFVNLFEFYVSWFPDQDKNVIISEAKTKNSPFYIPENTVINFNNLYKHPRAILEPVWIPFFVKKDFFKFTKDYAKIELNTIAYQMEI
jgi:hypothetical protein